MTVFELHWASAADPKPPFSLVIPIHRKFLVDTVLKSTATSMFLALILASILSAAYAQSPARAEDIGLMLAYPLSLVDEPEMWGNCGSSKTSYRFTGYAPDRDITAVRLSRVSERASARIVQAQLPDEPKSKDGPVTEAEWAHLEALIVTAEFWDLPTEESAWKLEPDNSVDYIEGCKNGLYHAIRLDQTNRVELGELFSFLMSFYHALDKELE